jgi:hypothetical protein
MRTQRNTNVSCRETVSWSWKVRIVTSSVKCSLCVTLPETGCVFSSPRCLVFWNVVIPRRYVVSAFHYHNLGRYLTQCSNCSCVLPTLCMFCHDKRSRYSSVSIVTRLRAGRSGVRFPVRERDFLFSVTSRPAVGPTQLPVHWVHGFCHRS